MMSMVRSHSRASTAAAASMRRPTLMATTMAARSSSFIASTTCKHHEYEASVVDVFVQQMYSATAVWDNADAQTLFYHQCGQTL
jgi:hypothetical protein